MNRLFSAKPLLAAAVALGALGAASAAQARTDVVFSVGIPAYVEPAPVYVQPQPVYVQPQVEYGYVQPRVVEYYGHDGRYERDWRWREARREEWRREQWRREHGAWRDSDRDGVPDRYDHAPYNPYRR